MNNFEWERTKWPEFRRIDLTREQAECYYKKFSRHFKIRKPNIAWESKKRQGGQYQSMGELILLPKKTNFGTVIHEFAHHFAKVEYGRRQNHNKNWKRCLKKTYTFAKRYL